MMKYSKNGFTNGEKWFSVFFVLTHVRNML